MRFLVYVLLMLAALPIAGLYGGIHNQLSFSISAEYFTHFKYEQFRMVALDLPDRLKVSLIGFLASWWMGVPVGLVVASLGWVQKQPREMWIRTLEAYGIVAATTLLVGLGGAVYGWSTLDGQLAAAPGWLPPDLVHPARFLIAGTMHNASYLGGVVGLIAGAVYQGYRRPQGLRIPAEIGSI